MAEMVPMVEWYQVAASVGKIALAYFLALPIGWEREQTVQGMGVRTFPLTAVASCGYVLIGESLSPEGQSRIIQGLLAGIGFLGAGAIMKSEGSVRGSATAASIFNTGVIGAAVALGRYEIAIILAGLNLLTLRLLVPLKKRLGAGSEESGEEK